jgi:hypothetical protein
VWETGLAAFLLSWLFLVTLRLETNDWTGWLKLGGLWGVAALAAPSVLGFLPFSLLYPAWRLRREGTRTLVRFAAASALVFALTAPWLIRNFVVFHRPVFLRSNYWFEFSLGNLHGAQGQAWSGAHPASNPPYLQHYAEVGEVAFVAERKARAFTFVSQNKAEFLAITLKRIRGFWDGSELAYEPPDPFKPWMMAATSLLAVAGLWLALRRHARFAWVFFAVLAMYPIPYYLTYTNPRYRHPIEPMMVVLTGYVLSEGLMKVKRAVDRT